jgi:hypothetical protein
MDGDGWQAVPNPLRTLGPFPMFQGFDASSNVTLRDLQLARQAMRVVEDVAF